MADIAPLTPLRYDLTRLKTLASVVAPPYDVIDAAQRAELAARDPHNVVQLILPEGEGDAKYANAAKLFTAWCAEGVLPRDEEPAFYRYDQSFSPPGGGARRTRRGFLGLVRLVPFSERIVLPHEKTLSGPKEDRLKLFRATRTNLSPGFMLYKDPQRALDGALARADALAELTTADGVEHALAKVRDRDAIRAIVEGVSRSSLLIADGHHRYETALRYAQETEAAAGKTPDRAEHKWFMVFLANGDDPELVVFPTHRHVHGLPGFDFAAMVSRAERLFSVRRLPNGSEASVALEALREGGPGTFAACGRAGEVVVLGLKRDIPLSSHPTLGPLPEVLRRTDVALLHAGLLEDVLGITPEAQAAKTNIWYPQDAPAALAKLRSGEGDALFLMNATPVADVRAVAEAGHVMPQKSTFFYPKVLTGLAIHTLEPARRVASG
ncbi:MAG: DUF1015 domain-containing protein [Polyangiaceae bacterium]|jgi:uncharacterized protein (DUF1015 family)